MLRVLCLAWGLLALSGACGRSASPAIAPVQPVPARGPGPAPSPAAEPAPPPKEAPANLAPDAPQSPAAAAPQLEDKELEPAKPPAVTKPAPRVREIRPLEGAAGCVEMYGTCTPPPDQLCTTSALHVDCGQRGQVPPSGEWVQCVCGK